MTEKKLSSRNLESPGHSASAIKARFPLGYFVRANRQKSRNSSYLFAANFFASQFKLKQSFLGLGSQLGLILVLNFSKSSKFIHLVSLAMSQNTGALEAAGVRVFAHPHFLDCGCPLYAGHPQNRNILVKLIICCPC